MNVSLHPSLAHLPTKQDAPCFQLLVLCFASVLLSFESLEELAGNQASFAPKHLSHVPEALAYMANMEEHSGKSGGSPAIFLPHVGTESWEWHLGSHLQKKGVIIVNNRNGIDWIYWQQHVSRNFLLHRGNTWQQLTLIMATISSERVWEVD